MSASREVQAEAVLAELERVGYRIIQTDEIAG